MEQKVYHSFHDGERINEEEAPVVVPANQGIYVQLETGHFEHFYNATHGFNCKYTINYQLDKDPPNPPTGLSMENPGDGGMIIDADGVHTRHNQMTLRWDAADDNGTSYKGKLSGPGGVIGYRLFRNGAALNNWSPGTQATVAIQEEGSCTIQVKARDFDDNKSDFSAGLTLIVDRSVETATLPVNR